MIKKLITVDAEDIKQPVISAAKSASAGLEAKSKSLFYLTLSLPAPLTDVTGDSKKHELAKSLLTPLEITQEPIPEHLVCQFTEQIFAEPVFTAAGEVYESELMTKWLTDHNYDPRHPESPLESKKLNPANPILRQVHKFLEKKPQIKDSDAIYLPRHWIQSLETACKKGEVAMIKRWCDRDQRLLRWPFEDKEYPHWQGKTIFHLACEHSPLESLITLVDLAEKRVSGLALLLLLNKDKSGNLPIYYAMRHNTDRRLMCYLAALMSKYLADVSPVSFPTAEDEKPRQMTAMHLAAMNNNVDILKVLLARGADVGVKNKVGDTALHAAVACGSLEAVILLVNAGASSNIENDSQQTPELIGVYCEQPKVVAVMNQTLKTLGKQQQQQLQQAGPIGLTLLQMQQMLEQSDKEIKSLRRRLAVQSTLLHLMQGYVLKNVNENYNPSIDDPVNSLYLKLVRQILIRDLPQHPLLKSTSFQPYAWQDDKDHKDEFVRLKTQASITQMDKVYMIAKLSETVFLIVYQDGRFVMASETNDPRALKFNPIIYDEPHFEERSRQVTLTWVQSERYYDSNKREYVTPKGYYKYPEWKDDQYNYVYRSPWNKHGMTCKSLHLSKANIVMKYIANTEPYPDFVCIDGAYDGSYRTQYQIRNYSDCCYRCDLAVAVPALLASVAKLKPNEVVELKMQKDEKQEFTTAEPAQGIREIVLPEEKTLTVCFPKINISSITIQLGFQLAFMQAGAEFYSQGNRFVITTAEPCEVSLKICATALKQLCPEYPIETTVTATALVISGVADPGLQDDLAGLCQALGARKTECLLASSSSTLSPEASAGLQRLSVVTSGSSSHIHEAQTEDDTTANFISESTYS